MVTFEKLDYWRELEQQDTDMPSTRVRLGSVRYYSKSTDGQQNEFIEESKMRNFSNPVAELLKAEEENAVQTKDTGEHDDRASSSGASFVTELLRSTSMDNKAALRKYIANFNTSGRVELGKSPRTCTLCPWGRTGFGPSLLPCTSVQSVLVSRRGK